MTRDGDEVEPRQQLRSETVTRGFGDESREWLRMFAEWQSELASVLIGVDK